jgi:hypothetical protein
MTPTRKKDYCEKTAKEMVARKKAVITRKTSVKKVAKKSTIPPGSHRPSINISTEERWKMIAIAAYYKAEKREFAPGGELQDWIDAENEIGKHLSG